MGIRKIDDAPVVFHEVDITVDTSDQYAEILDVYRTAGEELVIVQITSIRLNNPSTSRVSYHNANSRRLKP